MSSINHGIIDTYDELKTTESKNLKRGYPNAKSIQAIDIECTTAEIPAICIQDIMGFIPPATSNCGMGGLVVTAGPPMLLSGMEGCIGAVYFVQYEATDNCGQEAACAQDFVLVAPTITCPPDETGFDCADDLPAGAITIEEFIDAGGTIDGDCDEDFTISFTDSPDPSTLDFCTSAGLEVIRTYTITDECGTPMTTDCTQSFMYNVDTVPPTASNPTTITVECTIAPDPDPTVVTDEMDDCDSAPVVAFVSDVSDGNMCPEVITRTYSITDACGNSTTVEQIINLDDTMIPVITCPGNLVLECDGDYDAEITEWLDTATATDGCTTAEVTNDYVAGTLPLVSCDLSTGLTVIFNAMDECGNMAEPCSATIILDDTVPPMITCPANLILECDGDYAAEITDWLDTATATDGCTPPTITNDYVPGTLPNVSCDASEGITVTFTATDECGNTDTCTALIVITDTAAPIITCPPNVTGLTCNDVLTPGATLPNDFIATEGGSINEVCGGSVMVSFVDDGVPADLDFCSSMPLVITRTYTITDDCGNAATCNQTFSFLPDTTPPTASNPDALEVVCFVAPAPDPMVVTDEMDDCDTAPVVAFVSDVSDGNMCPEMITRTYSITDVCGNSATVEQIITLNDLMDPTITCPADLVLECDGVYADEINDWLGTAAATDGCSTPTITTDYVAGMIPAVSCDQSAGLAVVFTATDECGNTATCTASIIIDDTIAPMITCPVDLVLECDGDYDAAITAWLATATGTDACAPPTITNDYIAGTFPDVSCDAMAGLTVTFTATDECDNTATCTALIIITDTVAPEITCPADLIDLVCTDVLPMGATNSADFITAGGTIDDACGGTTTVTFVDDGVPADLDFCSSMPLVITRTYTITDECGNASTCPQTFNFLPDTTPPTASNPPTLIVDCTIAPAPDPTVVNDEMDDCDSAPVVTFVSDVSDGNMNPEEITRTYSITDACGNSATVEQIIILDDITVPMITCPDNLTLECDGVYADEIDEWLMTATSSDDCTTTTITNDYVPGTLPAVSCDESTGLTVVFTATDESGNTATCTASIIIDDTVAPMITCPADLVLECDGDYEAEIADWLETVTATDACAPPVITNDYVVGTLPDLSCSAMDGLTVTFTATDECDNTATCTALIIITDTVPPVITCPDDVVDLICTDDLPMGVTTSADFIAEGGTIDDACGGETTVSFVDDAVPADLDFCENSELVITRTYTITDECGNASTCDQTFTYLPDTTEPVVDCTVVEDLTLECGDPDNPTLVAEWLDEQEAAILAAATDDCGDLTIINNYITGTYPSETICCNNPTMSGLLITFVVSDECGNTSSCMASLFLDDNLPPLLNCAKISAPLVLECNAPGQADLIDDWLMSTGDLILSNATDQCTLASNILTVSNDYDGSIPDFSCDQSEGLTVNFTVTDCCGNSASCSSEIIVDDTTPPVMGCPADLLLECGDDANFADDIDAWLLTALFSDLCSMVTVTNDYDGTTIPDFSCDLVDGVEVSFTATDECGNTATCSSFIFQTDTTVPDIDCPNDLILNCDNDYEDDIANWLTTVSATDICDTAVDITNDYVPGSEPPLSCDLNELLAVTFTATDDCGNTSTCEAMIFIDDNFDPDITCPGNLILECDNDYADEIDEWLTTVTATDGCDLDLTITNDYTPGDLPALSCDQSTGITVTFTATDDCGNEDTCTATIIIDDSVLPVITCPADLILECDGDYDDEIEAWLATITATDVCDMDLVIEDDYDGSIPDVSCDATMGLVVTFTATDDCDNVASCTATIIITDTMDPVITCPADLTLECDGDYTDEINDWLALPTATDICDMAVTITNDYDGSIPDVSCDLSMGLVVTFTATDDCDNTDTCVRTIFITDTVAPDLKDPAMDVTVECDGSSDPLQDFEDWLADAGNSEIEDDCDSMLVITNNSMGLIIDCGITGTETVTFTATDACGNFVETTATFTITDMTPPDIITEAMDFKIECSDADAMQMSIDEWLADNGGAVATDACGTVVWTNDSMGISDDCGGTGFMFVTFTATDECGNTATTQATFTAGDDTPPEIEVEAMDETVECDGTPDPMGAFAAWLADNGGAVATDVCGDVIWTNNSMGLSDLCGATGTETVIFTATDECDNFSTTTATFTIEDTTDPVWIMEPADMTVECDGTADPDGAFAAWLISFTGMDTCGDVVVTNNSMGLSDLCGATGAETVTFTLTDECDNFITADATFTIEDTTNPVWINAPMDMTIECDGIDPTAAFMAWLNSFTGMDTCGDVVVTNNSMGLSDECGMTGTETVTFTLTDECDNFITDMATFTIEDNTAPIIDPMAMDMTVECDGTADPMGAFADWLADNGGAVATDACGMVTWTNNSMGLSDLCGATGAETVIFTATDECGIMSTTMATFTIEDTTAPVIDPMAMDMTVECDGTADPMGAFAAWLADNGGAMATDVCGMVTWSNNSMGLSDLCGATGAETVIFTATDECGVSSTTEATFTIEDTTAPVIDPMAMDMTIECDGSVDPMDMFAMWLADNAGAEATDVCGIVTWSNNSMGLSDDCGATGSETVTFTATDECGNTSTTEATFTIEDNTSPVIDPMAMNMTVECDGTADPMGAFAAWLDNNGGAMATDVCGMVTWSNNSMGLSDLCGATGEETVIFTATDECGNTSTTMATFTIEDTTDPVIDQMAMDMTVECTGMADPMGAFAAWLADNGGAEATDVCGMVTWTNNSMGLSDLCGATGAETVIFTATDECGLSSTTEATFTIEDTTAPVITCITHPPFGTNATTCDSDVVIPEPSTSDACGTVSVSWTASNGTMGTGDASGTYPLGTTTVTYTATDECGNTSSCTEDIIVIDNVGPSLTCANAQCLILDENGELVVPATDFAVSAIDNCPGPVSIQAMIVGSGNAFGDNVSFDCNSKGLLMVMVEATDSEGNATQCQVEVTIKDTSPPSLANLGGTNNVHLPDITINCEFLIDTTDLSPFGSIVFDAGDIEDIIIDGVVVGQDGLFTDNCGDGLFILSDTADDSGIDPQCGQGDLVRTVVVSDASGNTTDCVQTITVIDEDPFTCDEVTFPADFTIEGCEVGSTDPAVTGEPIFMIDKCSLVGTNFEDVVIDNPLSGCPYIERTWTVLDWCQFDPNDPGSEGICIDVQILTYVNSIAPTIVSGGLDTLICANPNTCIGEVSLLLTANDDCTDSLDIAYNWSVDINGAGTSIISGTGNMLVANIEQGNHIVTWEVEDRCGNITTQVQQMEIADCKAPLLACKFGLATTLLPKNGGSVVIWANDFVKSVEDNCTDLEDITISFSADPTDTNMAFNCDDLGQQTVEIWATDSNGNTTFCTTFINIQDNLEVCPDNSNGNLMIAGELLTEMGDPIALAEVIVEGDEMIETDMTDGVGVYSFENLPVNDDYLVVPDKNDDHINGVSTIDLVLIQKHILGIDTLDSPYKLIAADANGSESISAVDLIEIRKLILGVIEEFPNNHSWRFVDEEFTFHDPTYPWPFVEEVMNSDMSTNQMNVDFIGVKIGDVNNTVESNGMDKNSSNRSSSSLELQIDNQQFSAGDIVKVDVKSSDFVDIIGLQYTLNIDGSILSHLATEPAVLNITDQNIGHPSENQLTMSWNTIEGKSVADGELLFRLSFIAHGSGTLSNSLELNSAITSAEAYNDDLEILDLGLEINSLDEDIELFQNVPNPFSSYTDIRFKIPESQEVDLTIYSADGKKLWNRKDLFPAGTSYVQINKKDLNMPSGILYLEMKANNFIATKKMILLQ
jgi:hypothetical protein